MSDTSRSRLKVSREGIVLIKSFEGFRPRAVRDESGGWVIGYGHTASAREGGAVSEQDAELLLQYDLMPVVKALNTEVVAPLNQHQFDALASFAVSVGVDRFLSSDVLRRLNAGSAGEAADALIGWPQTARSDSALRRRAAERAMFVTDPASPVHLADLLAAPLPPPPVPSPPESPPANDEAVIQPDFGAAARAAAVATLLGEDAAPAVEVVEDSPPEIAPPPSTSQPRLAPFASPATMRYSPYATALIGPLPGFPAATSDPAPAVVQTQGAETTDAAPSSESDSGEAAPPEPEPAPVAIVPLVPPPPPPSPFPPVDDLVLTPAAEADFIEAARPVWPADQRAASSTPAEEEVLFEDEPTLSVLRHEIEPAQPRRFDWVETGPFMIMGGVGLAACAASAAAFRKAMMDRAPLDDYTVIAWVLALIGIVCVGVSAWNLHVRITKPE